MFDSLATSGMPAGAGFDPDHRDRVCVAPEEDVVPTLRVGNLRVRVLVPGNRFPVATAVIPLFAELASSEG